jgi:hypothetical protein
VTSEDSRIPGFKGSSEMLENYKDLKVWQKSYALCLKIYGITAKFPKEEIYDITSQLRRSVVSIPSNIAEGNGKKQRPFTLGCFTYHMVRFANWRLRYY